jgi:tetrahydromethanopterin S-methyltransferase subunit B
VWPDFEPVVRSIRLKNKQPGLPVGCVIERLKVESLINTIKDVVESEDPSNAFLALTTALTDCLPTRESSKHMAGRYLGRQEEISCTSGIIVTQFYVNT